MFTIAVEEVFQISARKGLTLVGKTSGVIKIGDYITDVSDRNKQYKVIGLEMVRYLDKEKNLTHNPAILIECDSTEPIALKNKIFESQEND